MSELVPLDLDPLADVLSKRPFVTIDGVCNLRDLGMIPVANGEHVTRSGFMYGSGELSGVTEHGSSFAALVGITTIFDLRSDTEIAKYDAATPQMIEITVLRAPVFAKEDYSPERMAQRFQLYASGKTEAFMRARARSIMQLYSEILDTGGPAFGAILRHVRDSPNDGFIFHCTAGKDRTGIAAALLLLLAGASSDAIAADYAITHIGLGRAPETMQTFLDMLSGQYGGVKEYVRCACGLSDQDIAIIQKNILSPRP